jgi:hypothetical protein
MNRREEGSLPLAEAIRFPGLVEHDGLVRQSTVLTACARTISWWGPWALLFSAGAGFTLFRMAQRGSGNATLLAWAALFVVAAAFGWFGGRRHRADRKVCQVATSRELSLLLGMPVVGWQHRRTPAAPLAVAEDGGLVVIDRDASYSLRELGVSVVIEATGGGRVSQVVFCHAGGEVAVVAGGRLPLRQQEGRQRRRPNA